MNLSIRLPIYNPSVLVPEPDSPSVHRRDSVGSVQLAPGTPTTPTTPRTPRLVVTGTSSEKLSATPESELNATWEMWDLIRSICDYNPRLTLSEKSDTAATPNLLLT
jgi:type II protein arginine methyltransferase